MTDPSLDQQILKLYKELVSFVHPNRQDMWPIISGHNCKIAYFKGWIFVIFSHTGNAIMRSTNMIGELTENLIGCNEINNDDLEAVRFRLEKHYTVGPRDGIVFIQPNRQLAKSELSMLLLRHELALGLAPMKIFLSHKGFNKPLVRQFKSTLSLLGFEPWLDEEAMPAGRNLEREILKGFDDSCAAVFFVTPQFKDESYIATEVEYAIAQKRKKGERFSIITLVFDSGGAVKGVVPDLLHNYVWKEPNSDLEALQEIIRALPIQVGDAHWRL